MHQRFRLAAPWPGKGAPAEHTLATGANEVLKQQHTIHTCAKRNKNVRWQFRSSPARSAVPAGVFRQCCKHASMLKRNHTPRTATSAESSATDASETSSFKATGTCQQTHVLEYGRTLRAELIDTSTPCQNRTRRGLALICINVNDTGPAAHRRTVSKTQTSLH